MIEAAERALTSVARPLLSIAGLLILFILALIGFDVFCRGVFDAPIRGVPELVSVAIPALVFLALPQLFARNELIRSPSFLAWLGRRSQAAASTLNGAFFAIGTLMTAAIALPSIGALYAAVTSGEFLGVEGEFTVAVWPAKLAIAFGASVLACMCGFACSREIRAAASLPTHEKWRTLGVVAALAIFALVALVLVQDNRAAIGGISIAVMLVLIYAGAPVAFALGLAAALGIGAIKNAPEIAVHTLALVADSTVSEYVFAAVPLFVFMGLIVGAADIGRDSLLATHWLLRRLRGGLGVATVAANAVFAAITGISIASAAIFSRVAVPPLVEQGFTKRFAVGLVAGSSVLGMLIPPSLLLIVYGLIAEVSINRLFIAAIIPGLLLASAFALGVVLAATFKPRFAITNTPPTSTSEVLDGRAAMIKFLPVLSLIAVVLGGIYGGVFTPTEAGAIGSIAATCLALAMRRLCIADLRMYLENAAANSASILFLIIAASAFAIMLTLSGIPGSLSAAAASANLELASYALVYLALLIMLGMVLDSTSILLIMVPLALPTVQLLGGDLVWFGIISVIGVEIGLLTPPLGLSVYAIKASLEDDTISLNDIFLGALPFSLIMLCVALALIFYPAITQVI